jgi:hypothetical protein
MNLEPSKDGVGIMPGKETKERAADEEIVEFAKELSEALIAQGLNPKDDNVQKTVAVCAQVFGELISDLGKTMSDFNDRLKRLVAKKAPK